MCVGSRFDLDVSENVYTGTICALLLTAFRLWTETDDLPPMKIFSAICLRDTGLISVFDEMDEEY